MGPLNEIIEITVSGLLNICNVGFICPGCAGLAKYESA
jgi:hypothetical protein